MIARETNKRVQYSFQSTIVMAMHVKVALFTILKCGRFGLDWLKIEHASVRSLTNKISKIFNFKMEVGPRFRPCGVAKFVNETCGSLAYSFNFSSFDVPLFVKQVSAFLID